MGEDQESMLPGVQRKDRISRRLQLSVPARIGSLNR